MTIGAVWIIVMLVIVWICIYRGAFKSLIMTAFAFFGETNDSRLNNLLVEHWFHAFTGKESFSVVNIFYPMPDTVAFTDMLVGFAIPYSILRAFGMNMFLANKIVLISFHVFGSYTFYYLLKRKFKIDSFWSLVGVVIFSYSSAYYVRIGHTQLMAISLIPILIIFIYSFFEKFQSNKKRILYAVLSITTYALIMYTSWYTAFFTALFFVTMILTYLIVSYSNKNRVLKVVFEYIKTCWKEVVAYCIYAICIVIPFFQTLYSSQ